MSVNVKISNRLCIKRIYLKEKRGEEEDVRRGWVHLLVQSADENLPRSDSKNCKVLVEREKKFPVK